MSKKIDWSPFDSFSENTIECTCGATYRSHSKAVMSGTRFIIVSRKPCPGCGSSENIRRSSSDPEKMTIGGK
jgi:hypothetical protein